MRKPAVLGAVRRELPDGQAGMLVVRTPSVTPGYWDDRNGGPRGAAELPPPAALVPATAREDLPVGVTGKVLKRVLRERHRDPLSGSGHRDRRHRGPAASCLIHRQKVCWSRPPRERAHRFLPHVSE